MASICELTGCGTAITVDIQDNMEVLHARIMGLIGDSLSEYVERKAEQIVGDKTARSILDSDIGKNVF